MSGSEHYPATGLPAGAATTTGGTPPGFPDPGGQPDEEPRGRTRHAARGLAVPVLLVAVLVPYALAFTGLWTRHGDDLADARRERAGVVVLRPVVRLVGATADAQSSAVGSGTFDAKALKTAMAEVEAADAKVGSTLGTDRRWTDLKSRLDRLVSSVPNSSAAYTAFSEVIDLEIAMLTAVVDSSGLRVDPQLDVHYLVDAGGVHVPDILVTAGRISDLTLLTERRRNTPRADTISVVVAQSDMREAATRLDDGLRKGFDSESSRTLGPTLLRELDKLRDAVTTMAPPMSGIGSLPDVPPTSDTTAARQQLRGAALEAETAALDQLDELLRIRADGLEGDRRTQAATGGVAIVVALTALWFVVTGRRRAVAAEVRIPPVASSGVVPPAPPITGAIPTRPGDAAPAGRPQDLFEARALLESRQLVRAGRAATPVPEAQEETESPSEEGR